nr:pentatricopeptide repeat-containing protein At1g50270 [Ipomoea trifida]
MLKFFQKQNSSSFTHDKPIAVLSIEISADASNAVLFLHEICNQPPHFGIAIQIRTLETKSYNFSTCIRSDKQLTKQKHTNLVKLHAHGGLVDEGQKLFAEMDSAYEIQPTVDHYGCMVDLLGQAGRQEGAVELIAGMPMEPTPGVWGALFGACMIHKEYGLGEWVGNLLIRIQPHHSGRSGRRSLSDFYQTLQNLRTECYLVFWKNQTDCTIAIKKWNNLQNFLSSIRNFIQHSRMHLGIK